MNQVLEIAVCIRRVRHHAVNYTSPKPWQSVLCVYVVLASRGYNVHSTVTPVCGVPRNLVLFYFYCRGHLGCTEIVHC